MNHPILNNTKRPVIRQYNIDAKCVSNEHFYYESHCRDMVSEILESMVILNDEVVYTHNPVYAGISNSVFKPFEGGNLTITFFAARSEFFVTIVSVHEFDTLKAFDIVGKYYPYLSVESRIIRRKAP